MTQIITDRNAGQVNTSDFKPRVTSQGVCSTAAYVLATVFAFLPLTSSAQETLPEVYQPPTVITEAMREQQIREGNAAVDGAGEHAERCRNCIGIVLNIGDDTRLNVHRRTVAHLEEQGYPLTQNNMDIITPRFETAYINHYTQEYQELFGPDFDVQVYPASYYGDGESAIGSSVDFAVGRILYDDGNGQSSFALSEVSQELADSVVEFLDATWRLDPILQMRLQSEQSN